MTDVILTDDIAKNYGRSYCQHLGRCGCPCVWDGNSTLLRILIILLSKVADVIAINFCGRW